jgi:glutaminyl-peptide cyclotransferase
MRTIVFFFSICLSLSCNGGASNSAPNTNALRNTNSSQTQQGPAPVYTYEIVNSYPHDPKAFTQGLFFHNGFLYESTGQQRLSTLRKVEIETGKVVQKFDLPPESFAEGIALHNGLVYQLTWQEGICRVFDVNDFKLIREFNYQGEGWGITSDGTNLYMTDKTHVIRVLNPDTFRSQRMLVVMREDGKPLMNINELEYIKGELWGNIWHSEQSSILGKPNYIVRIDPQSGKILGWVDLAGISPDDQPKSPTDQYDPKSENTLNGIAYDAANDRIFVTGKNWKKLYEIKVKEKPAA